MLSHSPMHNLVVSLMRGSKRLNTPRPHFTTSWDLSLVLSDLQRASFELFEPVELNP